MNATDTKDKIGKQLKQTIRSRKKANTDSRKPNGGIKKPYGACLL